MRLHHVQVSMPRGQEATARAFYVEALGLTEVPKPPDLAGRGGCWFRAHEGDRVTVDLAEGGRETVRGPVCRVRFDGLPGREKTVEIWLPYTETAELFALRTNGGRAWGFSATLRP